MIRTEPARGAGSFRLTRATALTLFRLLLAPAFAFAILDGAPVMASLLFALAVASDFGDGYLARRFGEATPLGGFVDHAVDAVFVTAGAAALAHAGVLPGALPVLIVAAVTQYAIDSRIAAGRPLRSSRLGRWNGVAYYAIVAVPVVRDALGLSWPPASVVSALAWVLVASSAASMLARGRAAFARRRGEPATG